MNRKNCEGCSFYKTEKEFKQGKAKARERIEILSPEQSLYIKQKYYSKGLQYNYARGII